MSEPSEGTAVVTTDQIYAELTKLTLSFARLEVRFEAVDPLEKRVAQLESERRKSWAVPFAWAATTASVVAAVYGNVKH